MAFRDKDLDCLKYKRMDYLVGVDSKNNTLKVSLEIQTNHIKLDLYKVENLSLDDFLETFNERTLDEKLESCFHHETESISDEEEYVKSEIVNIFNNLKNDFISGDSNKVISREKIKNIKNYRGESIELINWLASFSNMVLDKSIMEFVPSIVNSIKEVKLESSKIELNLNDYAIYMGAKEKYRGCIGLMEDVRCNSDATILMSFPGKCKKVWCYENSLLAI